MTLIIGFKCKEGVGLVSYTKITDDTGEELWDSKILTPMPESPFIIGAAGYTHLFREFNRKLPEVVTESINQIRIENVKELMKTGLTRDEAINYLYSLESSANITQQQELEQTKTTPPEPSKDITPIHLSHNYSAEKFIDDCKKLIEKVSANFDEDNEPIDVLIGLKRVGSEIAELHYISSKGDEEEIDDYGAIGSGSPYVKMLFGELYDSEKTLDELTTHAFRTIAFAQKVAKENSVGFNDEHPPEAVIVLNDGRYGRIQFENEEQVLKDVDNEMKEYKDVVLTPRDLLKGII